ncbi:MAG: class I SAM-dependent RNA methyltransferase [Clostridia bacterium]|nr:class I SAM-dependent RNA methyltransferase [Clostridia bacterium]
MTYTFVATCLFGLEHALGEEIDALGYERIATIDGRVTFRGDLSAAVRCNLWLRTAERLYLSLGDFHADSFEALFEGTRRLPWEAFIGRQDRFPVTGHAIKSRLYSIPDCQSIVKKAIVERLKAKYGISWFSEEGVNYAVEFFILNDRAHLMIDLSGTALHKRGYRPVANAAPLRETLAAALVKIARPREDVLFWDPMCGSGTIAIEAAMQMANIAPGFRRSFVAETFPQIDKNLWLSAREEVASLRRETKFEAYASDIDPDALAICKENCTRAGVSGIVKAFERNALEIRTGGRRGTIVTNPPYGERLLTLEETEALYRNMGKHFATLDAWQIYILTSHEQFEKLYNRRADKVRKLYNGMIPCYYYQFFKKPDPNARFQKNRPHPASAKPQTEREKWKKHK